MIDSFAGVYRFLSNFYWSPVEWEGSVYPTVEHAFQATKSLSPVFRERVRSAATPSAAKSLGRRVLLRTDWESVKIDVMRDLLRIKFAPGSDLARKLIATGDQDLVEGNTWGDRFWGVCNDVGQNHLGRLLMEVRTELRR